MEWYYCWSVGAVVGRWCSALMVDADGSAEALWSGHHHSVPMLANGSAVLERLTKELSVPMVVANESAVAGSIVAERLHSDSTVAASGSAEELWPLEVAASGCAGAEMQTREHSVLTVAASGSAGAEMLTKGCSAQMDAADSSVAHPDLVAV